MLLCLFVKSMMMMRMSGRESIKGGTWRRQRLSIVVWKKIHLLPQLHKTPKIIPGMRSHLSIHALPSNSTDFHFYFYLLSICQHTNRKDISGQPARASPPPPFLSFSDHFNQPILQLTPQIFTKPLIWFATIGNHRHVFAF